MGDDDNVSRRARVVHKTTVAAHDLPGRLSPTRTFQQEEVLNVSILPGQRAIALVTHTPTQIYRCCHDTRDGLQAQGRVRDNAMGSQSLATNLKLRLHQQQHEAVWADNS
jgi:hypothetical protein